MLIDFLDSKDTRQISRTPAELTRRCEWLTCLKASRASLLAGSISVVKDDDMGTLQKISSCARQRAAKEVVDA